MGQLFRSEEMQLVQLFIQSDAAHDTVDEIGKLGLVQFVDLNPDVHVFQRTFVNEIKRLDEMDRILRFFAEHLRRAGLALEPEHGSSETLDATLPIEDLEVKLSELERDLRDMDASHTKLMRNLNDLVEMRHVLLKAAAFFPGAELGPASSGDVGGIGDSVMSLDEADHLPLIGGGSGAIEMERLGRRGVPTPGDAPTAGAGVDLSDSNLRFSAGVINKAKIPTFQRLLWRCTRGNIFLRHSPIDEGLVDPVTGASVERHVFITFYPGRETHAKIERLCESFGANMYACPASAQARRDQLAYTNSHHTDLMEVLHRTTQHRDALLINIQGNLRSWREIVVREKSIYHALNMFNYDVGRKCLIAEGWIPRAARGLVQAALVRGKEKSRTSVPSVLSEVRSADPPPTHFNTNKFTSVFQEIVNAYGIPRYREANPGVFTIITFPFLFAVMFGDLGHGFILTAVAAAIIYFEATLGKASLNEMVQTLYDGRYILLLMGIFSMYTGLLYNEMFSAPMTIVQSSWNCDQSTEFCSPESGELADFSPYPIGVDPAWKWGKNELIFYNSLKMKMSVVFGVTQMTLGIVLSCTNGLYFKKMYNVYHEFVPQIIFMMSTFGYMTFLILYKWIFLSREDDPPRILNVMINMFLSPLSDEYHMYTGQIGVQLFLLFLALVSVPWMLLVKPYLLYRDHKRTHGQGMRLEDEDEDEEHGEEFELSEIMVHQAIHTIEFVLGAVSNTASYLRLWALSLAHAQLSLVFFERVLVASLDLDPGLPRPVHAVALFVGFAVWAALTVGVLMCMESLSAFLHALRLHWVEFQNKFYLGDGKLFTPMSHKRAMEDAHAEMSALMVTAA